MRFEAHGRKYSINIVKGAHRTRIKGSGWKKFTSDFSLQKGAVVIFDLDRRPRQAYVVAQSVDLHTVEGSSSDGDANEEMIDGDMSDVDEDGGSIKIEYTRGLTLNDAQQGILNELVLSFKSKFLGVCFVHCLLQPTLKLDKWYVLLFLFFNTCFLCLLYFVYMHSLFS